MVVVQVAVLVIAQVLVILDVLVVVEELVVAIAIILVDVGVILRVEARVVERVLQIVEVVVPVVRGRVVIFAPVNVGMHVIMFAKNLVDSCVKKVALLVAKEHVISLVLNNAKDSVVVGV